MIKQRRDAWCKGKNSSTFPPFHWLTYKADIVALNGWSLWMTRLPPFLLRTPLLGRTLSWMEPASAPLWSRVFTVVVRPAVFAPLEHQLQLIENL